MAFLAINRPTGIAVGQKEVAVWFQADRKSAYVGLLYRWIPHYSPLTSSTESDVELFTIERHEIVLADRTNGRAYATMLRPSVVCLWHMSRTDVIAKLKQEVSSLRVSLFWTTLYNVAPRRDVIDSTLFTYWKPLLSSFSTSGVVLRVLLNERSGFVSDKRWPQCSKGL